MLTARRIIPAIIAAACILGASPFAEPQAKRAMTLIDLIEVPRVFDAQLSPEGRQVLFTIDRPDWKANRRTAHIFRVNADGTGQVQLTNGERGESSPRWSPDGKTIAFLARRGDAEENQIYLIPNDGGEARPLSKHATSVSGITWSPDGAAIYFLASDPKTDEEKDKDKVRDDTFAYEENYKQQHLWKITVKDAAEQRITEGSYSVLSYRLSGDGAKIVFHRAPTPLYGDSDQGEVWLMDANGQNGVQLTKNQVEESDGELSPDGSQVLFVSGANQQFDTYYNGNLFLVPARGGTATLPIPDFPYEVTDASWSKDGRSIYVVANMGVHSELFQVDLATRTPRQLTDGRHAVQGWTFVAPADRHVLQFDEPGRVGDVWVMAPSPSAAPTRVTDVYGYLERDFRLPRQEKVEWKGADGVKVEGVLYYPLDYEQGKRYPLCVQTHGGPQASDKYGLGGISSYVPVLAAKGYAVLKPNYRGSTGYGNAFLRDMVGHYFQNAHLDVIAGVDYLIKQGIADPDRLVAMGWSGGGHMTNKLVTFTDRFKAASSGAGAANWISMYAQSDVRSYRTPWFGGTPWQKNMPFAAYWDNSPLKYVANVKTPTIFLVGQNDVRVPPPQSVEMFHALKSNGVPTHLYMAPREPHGWSELRHVLFKMNVELGWFEKYAMGRTYTWEKAPGDEKPKPKTATAQ
jgi:dipeptidyl aminopeptidase/acylaminoacyl peptidase